MTPSPRHHPALFWPADDHGNLLIAGIPLPTVAERVGSPSFYAYDASRLAQRIAACRMAFGPRVRLKYAVKANPFPPLVAALTHWVDGFDVASEAEMALVLDFGANPAMLSFASPGKRLAAIRRAVAAGVTVTVESAHQLDQTLAVGEALGRTPHVALRINPDFQLVRAGMRMGGGPQPFGIDHESVLPLLARLLASGARWVGLHLYAGSQLLATDQIREAHRASFLALCQLIEKVNHTPPQWLNIGGGLGIPYFPGETPLELGVVGEELQSLADSLAQRFPATALVIELGRYLVGEAGIFATQVLERKTSRGETFLVVDAGLNAHLAATGNLGQVLKKNYPVAIGNRMHEPASETVTIVGPLCTPLDRLATRVELPVAQPGDWVVLFQSGAYGATASPQRFLSHPPIGETLIWPEKPLAQI